MNKQNKNRIIETEIKLMVVKGEAGEGIVKEHKVNNNVISLHEDR